MTLGNNEQNNETVNAVYADEDDLVIRSLMPGYLVTTKFRILGGIKTIRTNERIEIETNPDGSTQEIKTYDVKQIVTNKEEYAAAKDYRKAIVNALNNLGIRTVPGLIVMIDNQQTLFETILLHRKKVAEFNEKSEVVNLIFDFDIYKSESENKLAIASISTQLDEILSQVQSATKLDDQQILEKAREKELMVEIMGKETQLTIGQILNGSDDQRREVVAKIRARITREALSEAQSFKDRLPEETGHAVSSLIEDMRKKARGWVKASKKSDEEYKEALEAVDSEGISEMQAALVMAAAKANSQIDQALQDIVEKGADPSILIGGEAMQLAMPLDVETVEDVEDGFTPGEFVGFGKIDGDVDGDSDTESAVV